MYIIFRQDNRQKNPNPESPVYLTCITLDHRTKPKCPERTLCRHMENTQFYIVRPQLASRFKPWAFSL